MMSARALSQHVSRVFSFALGYGLTVFAILFFTRALPSIIPLNQPDPIPFQVAIAALEKTRDDLERSEAIDKDADRICLLDESASLFCVAAMSLRDVSGHYTHEGLMMNSLRQVIVAQYPDRWTIHPILDFNNHADTGKDDVIDVVDQAIERLSTTLNSIQR